MRARYIAGLLMWTLPLMASADIETLQQEANKGNPEATLELGRLYFDYYDFDKAGHWYDKYAKLKKKGEEEAAFPRYRKELRMAEDFLNTVEKIVIVDSLTVSKEDFFKSYRLPGSAGSLLSSSEAPEGAGEVIEGPVFSSESGDFRIWGQEDEEGDLVLTEAVRLTDGGWHIDYAPKEVVNGGGDACYPYMMSDGTTLYFANDGDESIGGLDIFIASRDPATGEYMKPQNIGMPYNSPADDYMLAIDEENGIGWWATDRNQLEDQVTIYVFLTNDMRTNYDPHLDDIIEYARISDISKTWEEGKDYEDVRQMISEITPAKKRNEDFHFVVPGGKVYNSLNELPDATTRNTMQVYLEKEKELSEAEAKLLKMRKGYSTNRVLRADVLRQEKEVEEMRGALKNLRNNVIKGLSK